VKKKYYGKAEYAYTVYSLNIPKELHEFLPPFLNKDLAVDARRERNCLVITVRAKAKEQAANLISDMTIISYDKCFK